MSEICVPAVAMVMGTPGAALRTWRQTRWIMDSRVPSARRRRRRNCLEYRSLESGQRRLPAPPESSTICMEFSLFERSRNLTAL